MFDYNYQIRHYNLMLNACWSSDPGSPCSGLFCQGYALYRVPLLNYYLLTYLAVVNIIMLLRFRPHRVGALCNDDRCLCQSVCPTFSGLPPAS